MLPPHPTRIQIQQWAVRRLHSGAAWLAGVWLCPPLTQSVCHQCCRSHHQPHTLLTWWDICSWSWMCKKPYRLMSGTVEVYIGYQCHCHVFKIETIGERGVDTSAQWTTCVYLMTKPGCLYVNVHLQVMVSLSLPTNTPSHPTSCTPCFVAAPLWSSGELNWRRRCEP